MNRLILKPERERSLEKHHPWVFSGAIARVEGQPQSGETLAVVSASGKFLAWAAYSPQSQIKARVWSWQEDQTIDASWLRRRLSAAIDRRGALRLSGSRRLVFAEADGLPGVVLDQYGCTLVLQCLTAGADYWRDALARAALELTGAERVYERSDADVRKLEGLPERSGLVCGAALADGGIVIEEAGLSFRIDIRGGHKTGFYLDQSQNRQRVRYLAAGRATLDCFCYTGGFSLNLARGGARSVMALDSSAAALAQARDNQLLNDLPPEAINWIEGDVFSELRTFRDRGLKFDLIVLDPPKFAPTAALAEKAARAYKDINLLAMKLLTAGGLLVTFSCSGGVDEVFFQKILVGAAQDAHVNARIIERLTQAADHPVLLSYPESAYLKGFVLQVDAAQE